MPHSRKWLLTIGFKQVRKLILWIWGSGGLGRTFQAERRVRRKVLKTQQQDLPWDWRRVSEGQGSELRPNVSHTARMFPEWGTESVIPA